MRGIVNVQWMGRLGNCMFQYAYMRAYAEKHDLAFRTDPWDGEQIFDIQHERPAEEFPVKDENTLVDGDVNFTYRSYSQQQKCLIYSRADVRRWFKLKPEIEAVLSKELPPEELLAHLRRGDYFGYGYVLVSIGSYHKACERYGLDRSKLIFTTEETPHASPSQWPPFLADFWRLTHAKTILRANSSFSYWAAVLGTGRVFSPVIEGIIGGGDPQDVTFVEGNHPRFATFGFLTDLHLRDT